MAFDPMTGEPIEEKQENGLQFDPMTGEPIGQPMTVEQPMGGFDPMTGEPIGQPTAVEQPMGGFDPMTGEPIGQPTAAEQPMGGFDPMTGDPIGQEAAQVNVSTNKAMIGKNNKLPIIIGAIAGVAVVIVFVFVILFSGVFAGKAGKVTTAINNTFKKKPHFVETLEPLNVIGKDKYTIAISGEIDDIQMNGEVRISNKEKQVSATLDYEDYPKVEALASLDANTLKVEIPAISKNVFVYNYKKNNTGYLTEMLSDDEINAINAVLESTAGGNEIPEEIYNDLQEVISKEFKALKFTNAEKEEYTVDDKDVTCKGYMVAITADNVINVIDGIEEVVNNNLESLIDSEMIDVEELATEFEDIRGEAEYMEDIEVTFYIYKNMLAAVKVYSEDMDDEVELCFEGGDYRAQNMTLKMDSYRIQLKGEDSGSKEEFTLKARYGSESEEIGSLEYNYENGKFSFDIDGENVSGRLTKEGSSVILKINEINTYYESLSPDIEIAFTEGAKMQKFSGKEFDFGNADEDDFMDLAEDIQDEMQDSDLYYLFEDLF
ncbi:MAG: hypothetical protein IJE43_22180 [Alphaproteobacteria bacterium]|nr:hypothetical protein [Alphaproteobacteria bacterium]